MDLYELPGCCGASIIVDIIPERRWNAASNLMVEDISLTQERLHHLVLTAKNTSYGYVMAITVDDQIDIEPLLFKEGFDVIKQTHNPMHKTNLKTWFLDLNTLPGKPPEEGWKARSEIKIWPDEDSWMEDDLDD